MTVLHCMCAAQGLQASNHVRAAISGVVIASRLYYLIAAWLIASSVSQSVGQQPISAFPSPHASQGFAGFQSRCLGGLIRCAEGLWFFFPSLISC
ncbi:hypothetical protein An14g04570 [Aspergillus niger]|uniref:Uncharacterized protein n=2 Tax=Aspergillus niger TaxID=5061 RepID=A2R3K1_ASPNC|nr:hypothetical protein An14g04570 [Aspergillus niger]CAK42019.1 hypothetical protein An14g04570 [Aspergillus niger]